MPVVLGCAAALTPHIAWSCAANAENPQFDGIQCVQLRADPAAPDSQTVFLNRCDEPIAILVVVCDLAVRPACKLDPVLSKGWSARRGVEYVAPISSGIASLYAAREPHHTHRAGTLLQSLPPYAAGLPKGWRAQIAACKLDLESPIFRDPCVERLTALKRSLDASDGKSMHAALKDMRRHCST